jgi:hypothetical protein
MVIGPGVRYPGGMAEDWMLVSEAAQELQVSRWLIWQFMRRGVLTYRTQGKFRFVRTEDVARLKAARAVTHPHGPRRSGRPKRQAD